MISETKSDDSFPLGNFLIDAFIDITGYDRRLLCRDISA